MPRGFLRKENFTKETLLRIAALGVLTVVAGSSPYFLHSAVRSYFREKEKKSARARAKKLREMEKRKLISFTELGGGTVRIELTHKGKQLVRQYDLEKIAIKKPVKWDGRWRIVIYDIPTSQKQASNAFREKIRQLGLFPLQRSVWVSAYECIAEIEFLATVFNIDFSNCICYLTTKQVPKEREIKNFFSL